MRIGMLAAVVAAVLSGGCLCNGSPTTAAPYTGEVIVRAEPRPEAEWLVCATDADCTTFKDGCCGCNEGGKALAIAKKNADDYDGLLAFECGASACAMMISTDPTCKMAAKCAAGKCVLDGAAAPPAPATTVGTSAGIPPGTAPGPGTAAGTAAGPGTGSGAGARTGSP